MSMQLEGEAIPNMSSKMNGSSLFFLFCLKEKK